MQFLCFLGFAAIVTAQFQCPDWTLPSPWGKVKGTLNVNDVCVYSNIRFASPPTGKLRFQAPEYPPKSNDPIPGPNPSCIQTLDVKCTPGTPFDDLPGEISGCLPKNYGTMSEDCLFLDVYVPKQAFGIKQPVPVVVWFYGGAYLFGSKSQYDPSIMPFYDGKGPLNVATTANKDKTSMIFVRGNYRLGAFGWLAGSYMEANGQPNAGLLDQRAILRFVNQNIRGVNGNPSAVSVWGESAGASSIMHHMVMPQNVKEPLFQRAILQSPAFQWHWSRKDELNTTFTDFARDVAKNANCKDADMACLQSAGSTTLAKANQKIFQKKACDGIIPVGPAVDDNYIKTLAPISFAQGNIMPLDSVIVSHVHMEVPYVKSTEESTFVPRPIRQNPNKDSKGDNAFDDFLREVFPGDASSKVRDAIKDKYSANLYTDQIARAAALISESSFTCNTRFIIDAYLRTKAKVYAMDYALFAGSANNASTHASDLLPTFSNSDISYYEFARCVRQATRFRSKAEVAYFVLHVESYIAPGLQQYFTNHAIWGDPNYTGKWSKWSPAIKKTCDDTKKGTCVGNLMKAEEAYVFGDDFQNNQGSDDQTPSSICGFWEKMAQEIEKVLSQDEGKNTDRVLLNQEL